MWILTAVYLATDTVTFDLADDYSTAAVMKALLTLQYWNAPLQEIFADAGLEGELEKLRKHYS